MAGAAAGPSTLRCVGLLCCLGLALALVACGGGGSASAGNGAATFPAGLAAVTDANVAVVSVEAGPGRNVNIPYVSVTVCEPGTARCTTVDHVLLDTGSTGLRLFASQVNPTLTLPPQSMGANTVITECAQFLNTVALGRVHLADIQIGAERAPSVPIQLMDTHYTTLPSSCGTPAPPVLASASDPLTPHAPANTQLLAANGILGVGLFSNDAQVYFHCAPAADSCRLQGSSYPSPSQQVQNPVSRFTSANNNGLVIHLPAIPATGPGGTARGAGAPRAQGYLIFGVGTQANNQLGSAHVIPVDAQGFFSTEYRASTYPASFLDSGSNGLYFNDPSTPTPSVLSGTCSLALADFFCPASTQNLNASIHLGATARVTVNFAIANADELLNPGTGPPSYALNNLGGALGGTFFDWGLPFFFGKSVYTVIEGKAVNAGGLVLSGPLSAFTLD